MKLHLLALFSLMFVATSFVKASSDVTYQFIRPAIDLLMHSASSTNKTLITGRAIFLKNNFEYPVRAHKISLIKSDVIVSTSSTDFEGEFKIYGDFTSGMHLIKIDSDRFSCEKKVVIKTGKKTRYNVFCNDRGLRE